MNRQEAFLACSEGLVRPRQKRQFGRSSGGVSAGTYAGRRGSFPEGREHCAEAWWWYEGEEDGTGGGQVWWPCLLDAVFRLGLLAGGTDQDRPSEASLSARCHWLQLVGDSCRDGP